MRHNLRICFNRVAESILSATPIGITILNIFRIVEFQDGKPDHLVE